MEEKEKRTSKEEGSGYGLTADNDSCSWQTAIVLNRQTATVANRQTATVVDWQRTTKPIL